MLKQAIEIFKKEYNVHGDSMILDEYVPADGTYIIVDCKENDYFVSSTINIKQDKKTRGMDRTHKDFDFICFADYYSKLIDMNKPIDNKKIIHSNNYLSFFVKKDSLTNGKLTYEIIDGYYNLLGNLTQKYKSKKKSLEIYRILEDDIGTVDINKINQISTWIKNNIFDISKGIIGKDYLKFFFRAPKDEYIREGNRYLIPNIYNNNDFNELIKDEIYGLPNNNMGLNAKKPYLENKTRKCSIPYLINQNDALLQKKLFDYLMNFASLGKYNIYCGDKLEAYNNGDRPNKYFNGIYFRIQKGKELEIHDYDIITNFTPDLVPAFEYQNILGADYEKLNGNYKTYKTKKGVEQLFNEVLFSKFLINNYFTEPKDISTNDTVLKYNLITCRDALFNFFYKGINNSIWNLLDDATASIVRGSIESGLSIKSMDQFNLRISLKEYFEGGGSMADTILKIKDEIREKISEKETGCFDNDVQYLFAVGQLAYYFISRSKGKKKPLSLAKPFINARNDSFIKTRLKALYNKYDYDIESYATKFKNMYAMVSSYKLEGNIDSDMIIAGYLHSNMLYEKNDIEEAKGEN